MFNQRKTVCLVFVAIKRIRIMHPDYGSGKRISETLFPWYTELLLALDYVVSYQNS